MTSPSPESTAASTPTPVAPSPQLNATAAPQAATASAFNKQVNVLLATVREKAAFCSDIRVILPSDPQEYIKGLKAAIPHQIKACYIGFQSERSLPSKGVVHICQLNPYCEVPISAPVSDVELLVKQFLEENHHPTLAIWPGDAVVHGCRYTADGAASNSTWFLALNIVAVASLLTTPPEHVQQSLGVINVTYAACSDSLSRAARAIQQTQIFSRVNRPVDPFMLTDIVKRTSGIGTVAVDSGVRALIKRVNASLALSRELQLHGKQEVRVKQILMLSEEDASAIRLGVTKHGWRRRWTDHMFDASGLFPGSFCRDTSHPLSFLFKASSQSLQLVAQWVNNVSDNMESELVPPTVQEFKAVVCRIVIAVNVISLLPTQVLRETFAYFLKEVIDEQHNEGCEALLATALPQSDSFDVTTTLPFVLKFFPSLANAVKKHQVTSSPVVDVSAESISYLQMQQQVELDSQKYWLWREAYVLSRQEYDRLSEQHTVTRLKEARHEATKWLQNVARFEKVPLGQYGTDISAFVRQAMASTAADEAAVLTMMDLPSTGCLKTSVLNGLKPLVPLLPGIKLVFFPEREKSHKRKASAANTTEAETGSEDDDEEESSLPQVVPSSSASATHTQKWGSKFFFRHLSNLETTRASTFLLPCCNVLERHHHFLQEGCTYCCRQHHCVDRRGCCA
jgi:hypothetical protein